jgi:hypothetical protein
VCWGDDTCSCAARWRGVSPRLFAWKSRLEAVEVEVGVEVEEGEEEEEAGWRRRWGWG